MSVVIAAVGVLWGAVSVAGYPCDITTGTTKNIQEIFTGRCSEYVEKINRAPFCPVNKTFCDSLWDTFEAAFQSDNATCNTSADFYEEFMAEAKHTIPPGKSMFWQGVFGFVQELSYQGKRFFALEDTLYGYTLNNLNWCWSDEKMDFNYQQCPNRTTCPYGPLSAYWEAASRQFARSASGLVRVMINGSRAVPYQRTGFFGRVELPAMNVSAVDKITILVVHNLDLPVVEMCNGTTIKQLKEDIKERGLPMECIDDPKFVRFYMCVDDTSSPLCNNNSSGPTNNSDSIRTGNVLLPSILLTLFALFITTNK